MKSVHNRVATTEDKKRMTFVGNTTHPETKYTKDDFLTPAQVGKKFGISTDQAKEIMKKLAFKQAVFALNGHKTPVIVRLGSSTMKLHPMAFEVFQEYVNNQKVK